MREYRIKVVPVNIPTSTVHNFLPYLEKIFRAQVSVEEKIFPISLLIESFNEERKQIDAEKLLLKLIERYHTSLGNWIITLVEGDAYVKGLNFVFGIAKQGWGGIVFTYRLKPEIYGDYPRPSLYMSRIVKEVLHELGHALGLGHCLNHCVMRFSNNIIDVDNKPEIYCQRCRLEIRRIYPGLLEI